MQRKSVLSGLLFLLALAAGPSLLEAGEISQYFPADEIEEHMRTKWRVVWGIEKHAGQSQILYVKEAYFTRGPGEPEIKVLDDSRLAEIFVPYNGGGRIYDIIGYKWPLANLNRLDLGPGCIVPGQIYDKDGNPAETGPVALEIHDDHLRWMNSAGQSRRGQSMLLWSVLVAGNYRYVILYIFRDDGQIGFRVGATSHNLLSTREDWATHLHTSCWRVNLALKDQKSTRVSEVWLDTKASKTIEQPLDKEKRIRWDAETFKRLRIRSTAYSNQHDPASPIGYELLPISGSGRYYGRNEDFTQHDFWVTAGTPREIRCNDVHKYENGESLSGKEPVLWYLAGGNHSPRDEDFGKKEYDPGKGVALTAWVGFDLKPRDFFSSTPLYPNETSHESRLEAHEHHP
ncbi:MAG TPA: hypothetical protein VLQ45_10435 [Thermoanaerobaculia bacterium]|nr:hypothetical protein [Thermoanaerobaculia bacterium]